MRNREKYIKMVKDDFDKYKKEVLENANLEYLFASASAIADDKEIYNILTNELTQQVIDKYNLEDAEYEYLTLLRLGIDCIFSDARQYYYDDNCMSQYYSTDGVNVQNFLDNLLIYIK